MIEGFESTDLVVKSLIVRDLGTLDFFDGPLGPSVLVYSEIDNTEGSFAQGILREVVLGSNFIILLCDKEVLI